MKLKKFLTYDVWLSTCYDVIIGVWKLINHFRKNLNAVALQNIVRFTFNIYMKLGKWLKTFTSKIFCNFKPKSNVLDIIISAELEEITILSVELKVILKKRRKEKLSYVTCISFRGADLQADGELKIWPSHPKQPLHENMALIK